ncbi:ABC transporter permease [Brevundimonas subvibrioides]|uniref:ABC transporter permease n=1 Tax=Brevundimonas subvibrioides TaxID=74313 RepID=UPI0022B30919|nr:ABC transporter permease [Brevundimonas subvibrioides]
MVTTQAGDAPSTPARPQKPENWLARQTRIISALMIREMTTRYGRDGLGFAWIVLEPMSFCVGVLVLWSLTKPPFEHGIRLQAFSLTGYMCIILLRHMISYSFTAIQANVGLMHHRQVKPLHILISRNLLELGGTTATFVLVYFALYALGLIEVPANLLLAYCGWLMMAWVSVGLALLMTGLAIRFEPVERIVGLLTYVLIPLSGAFFMVSWLPPRAQEIILYLPFPHAVEMLRAGVFGPFVETHYDWFYALTIGMILNLVGLLLVATSRDQIDVE